jgi:putative inorganic carbon (HCO3(-)) transporter
LETPGRQHGWRRERRVRPGNETYHPDGTRWIYALYLTLLVWVPIPLGSNRAWSAAVLELWVFLIALAWLAGAIRKDHGVGPLLPRARPILLCLAVWLGYVWLQLLPWPIAILELISPEAARWHHAASLGKAVSAAPISLDPYATLDSALKSSAYVVFFVMTLILLRTRDRIRGATYATIVSGVAQALYGTMMSFRSLEGLASGTFVNRNHYAAYLVMCLSVGVGVLIASLSGEKNHSWRQFLRGAIAWIITPKMALRLLLVTMVIALVLTRSRMGNTSFFVSLLAAGLIGLLLSKKATRSMVVLLVSLIVIDIFIVGAYFGTQRVVERIGQSTVQSEDRGAVAGYAIEMWKDYPVFGSGLGSFAAVFPRYSAEGTPLSYTHAHNDFLEFAAEVGLVGFAMLGMMVVLSFMAALRAQRARRDPVMRGISFASIMGTIALMIHSSVDFNLQIPANALTFMLLLAFAWISLYCVEGEERESA